MFRRRADCRAHHFPQIKSVHSLIASTSAHDRIALNMATDKRIKFWRVRDLRNLELLSARQERSFPRRIHDRFEISVIESGAERLCYRRKTYTASAGSVVVISPGEAHAAQAVDDTGWSYRAFYPSASDVQDAAGEEFEGRVSTPSFSSPVIQDEYLARIIRELHMLLESPNSALAQETYARWAAFQLVTRHASNPPAVASVGNEHRAVRLARDFIQEHYQQNISLAHLAQVAGLSPFSHGADLHQANWAPATRVSESGAGEPSQTTPGKWRAHCAGRIRNWFCRSEPSHPPLQASIWSDAWSILDAARTFKTFPGSEE
jgi:hypothetical protein